MVECQKSLLSPRTIRKNKKDLSERKSSMTEKTYTKAEELTKEIEEYRRDIDTLRLLIIRGYDVKTDNIFVEMIKRFLCRMRIVTNDQFLNIVLTVEELKMVQECKIKKLEELEREFEEL